MAYRPHDVSEPVLVQPAAGAWPAVGEWLLTAEPDPFGAEWPTACWARLACASAGLVGVGSLAHVERFERGRVYAAASAKDARDVWRERYRPTVRTLARLGLGWGSPEPRLLVVGERAPRGQLPYCSRSGVWLLRALRFAGYDELADVYLTNALTPDETPTDPERGRALVETLAAGSPGLTVLATGRVARDAARAWVEGVPGAPVVHVKHPAHARRFLYGAGPSGYADGMLAAGLPRGPWPSDQRPGERAQALPEDLPGPLDRLPRSVAYRPAEGAKGDRVGRPKLEAVRQLYVEGQAKTITAAVRQLGYSPWLVGQIAAAAREEGWQQEREAFAAEVREKARADAVKAEAKALANTRRMAAHLAERSVGDVLKRMAAGQLQPTPAEAARLAELAMALAQEASDDAGVTGWENLTLRELAEKVRSRQVEQFGEGA